MGFFMSLIAITGAASGIGAATAAALQAAGHRVLGVDLRNAEIVADLSTADGRSQAVAAIVERSAGVLELSRQLDVSQVSVNTPYFGVVTLLDGLLEPLARGSAASAVVVSSVASAHLSFDKNPLGAALEAGDEAQVAAILAGAVERAGPLAYAGSKNAVTVAVRRRVQAWAQRGVRINTVAPGAVETPLLQAALSDARLGRATQEFVAPIARRARPDEIASMILYLLGPQASYIHGAQFVVDGGIDALARPTRF